MAVPSCKFLGVTLDSAINWKDHTQNLIKKLSSSAFVIRRFAKLDSRALAMLAYHSTFASHLMYGIEVWGGCGKQQMHDILIIQKRVVRSILKIPVGGSCRQGFKQLKILTASSMYLFKILLYGKTCIDNETLQCAADRHTYPTRSRNKIIVKATRTKACDRSPLNAACSFINALPDGILTVSQVVFKRKLLRFCQDGAFYSVDEAMSSLKSFQF